MNLAAMADALRAEFPGCCVKVSLYELGGAVFVHEIGKPSATRMSVWRDDGQMVDARTLDEAVAELKGSP